MTLREEMGQLRGKRVDDDLMVTKGDGLAGLEEWYEEAWVDVWKEIGEMMDRLLIGLWEVVGIVWPGDYVRQLRKFGQGMGDGNGWRWEEREAGCWNVGFMIQEELNDAREMDLLIMRVRK